MNCSTYFSLPIDFRLSENVVSYQIGINEINKRFFIYWHDKNIHPFSITSKSGTKIKFLRKENFWNDIQLSIPDPHPANIGRGTLNYQFYQILQPQFHSKSWNQWRDRKLPTSEKCDNKMGEKRAFKKGQDRLSDREVH